MRRDPFANDADRNIEGSLARDGQVWRAHLSVLGAEGSVLPAAIAAPVPPVPLALRPVTAGPGPSLSLSLRGAVALGLLPRPGLGVESGGEVGLTAHWALSVALSYFPEVRAAGAGFGFGLSAAVLGLLLLGSALWLEAGGKALAPLARHELVLKGQQDPVFQSSSLTFLATLGLSASIL